MQAILLAAGESSRMYPFSNGEHKSMIRILGKPLLEHMLEKLKNKNIRDIIIVVGNNNIEAYFGNGRKFGVNIKYVLQKNPEGAGNAILLSKDLLKNDFILLNAYHVEIDNLVDKLIAAKTTNNDGVLLVKEKEDVWNYGVVEIEGESVKSIIEKPSIGNSPSNFCIVGVYLLSKLFLEILEKTPPKHYQLEEALDTFVKGHNVGFVKTDEATIVLKYPWDLLNIKNYLLANLKKSISAGSKIASSAQLIGEVYIEDGTEIMENAVVKGPCYLGKNSFVGTNSILRDGVDLEEHSVVGANMEMKNTLLSEGSKTHSGFIGDSLVGKNCRIGAAFNSANVRIDRETVKTMVKGEKIDTGLKSLGVIIGNNTRFGIKSTTMPGIIVGENTVIGAGTVVMNNVSANVKYYTKFQEIITKNEK
jgi:bifunctional UDP-N-acetylglucosamine pyrophosphorylase/glucosamine-1-phosphate N-acetyltransferase